MSGSQDTRAEPEDDDAESLDKNELFELVLRDTGGFGRLQVAVLALSFLACFAPAFNHLSPIYTAFAPKFTCLNVTDVELLDSGDESVFDSACPEGGVAGSGCADLTFERSVMARTAVTEFSLVCERAAVRPWINTSYMFGVVVFNLVGGILSDRLGRRRTLVAYGAVFLAASVVNIFSNSVWFFMASRFFVGGTSHGAWSVALIICNEIGVTSKRGVIASAMNIGWNIGSILMTGLAYWLRDWRHLQISFTVINLSLLVLFVIIPESPRWLMLNDRVSEAKDVYRRMARTNGVGDLAKGDFGRHFSALTRKCKAEGKLESEKGLSLALLLRLLGYPEYRRRLLLLIPPWLAVGMSSYGIHFSVSLVNFNYFFLAAVKEVSIVAAIAVLTPVLAWAQRAPMALAMYAISGSVALSFLVIPEDAVAARVVMFLLAQATIVATFFVAVAVTPEQFSTDSRNSSFSLLDSLSKIGTMLAPFVITLGDVNHDLPLVLFGSSMLAASVVFLLYQETKGEPLMQDIRDLQKQERKTILKSCCAVAK